MVVADFKAKSQHLILAAELVSLPVADTIDISLKSSFISYFKLTYFRTKYRITRLFLYSFNGPQYQASNGCRDDGVLILSVTTTVSIGALLGSLEGIRLPGLLREKDSKSGFLSWTQRTLNVKFGGHLEL